MHFCTFAETVIALLYLIIVIIIFWVARRIAEGVELPDEAQLECQTISNSSHYLVRSLISVTYSITLR